MLKSALQARSRSSEREAGFTLVEVMVVVLIIGILLAIGIPTFLGARTRAQDRAAQSNLRTAQNTALIIYTDDADFQAASVANLGLAEPSLTWSAANVASPDKSIVSISNPGAGDEWGAAVASDSGMCFFIHLRADGSTQYGSSDSTACTGNNALTVTGSSW